MKTSRSRWNCGLAAAVNHVEPTHFPSERAFPPAARTLWDSERPLTETSQRSNGSGAPLRLTSLNQHWTTFYKFKNTTFSSFIWTFVNWVFTFLNPIFSQWTQRHLWDFCVSAVPSNHRLIWRNVKTRIFQISTSGLEYIWPLDKRLFSSRIKQKYRLWALSHTHC